MNNTVKLCEETRSGIECGARLKMRKAYGTGTKYFVCYLSDGMCLIADSKRDCKNEMGYIHSIWNIDTYTN